jgi:hypothetical protein
MASESFWISPVEIVFLGIGKGIRASLAYASR